MGVAVGAAPEEATEAARRGLLAQRDQEAPPLQGAHPEGGWRSAAQSLAFLTFGNRLALHVLCSCLTPADRCGALHQQHHVRVVISLHFRTLYSCVRIGRGAAAMSETE